MRNVDRITEAYNGAFGKKMMNESRERIHWICSQAKGDSVLDVGCSQGVAAIILAREGKNVHGIDICQKSIDFANASLEDEDISTKNCVQFLCSDFVTFSAETDKKFDAIIMSEIIEHLADPERFVCRAFDISNNMGRIIVTVPFGINDYHDHKRTYYAVGIYKLLSGNFHIESVEFLENYIGMVGIKIENPEHVEIGINESLFIRTEKAFYSHERAILNRAEKSEQKSEQWKKTAEDNLETSEQWKKTAEDNLESSEQWKLKLNEQQLLVSALQNEVSQADRQIISIQSEKRQADERLLSLEREKQKSDENLVSVQGAYTALADSKLGKIQIHIWKRRTEKKYKKKANIGSFVRRTAKKSPLLVYWVRRARGQKTTINETKGEVNPALKTNKELVSPVFDLDYFKRIENRIDRIPTSASGRYYRRHPHKLAVISDEFLYNAFKDVADSVSLHPQTWRGQIKGADILLIITGWKGIGEEWRGFARDGSDKRKCISDIIGYCKDAKIPAVFYSIEDPPNYDRFIGIAKQCDYVFSTAAEILARYREDCGHERVYPLMFGINPLYHNPVGSLCGDKMNEVIFSGSWMDKYTERGKDIAAIFDGVLASSRGLKIIDRNFALDERQYKFPAVYSPYISPAVSHEILQKVHKLYDWAININSVKESQTMFANRAFELLAAGNLILSNYSVGINSHLPAVYTVQDTAEVTDILNSLSPDEIRERQAVGIRCSMTGNTYFDRYAKMLEAVGIKAMPQSRRVAVVAAEVTPRIKFQFESQTYPDKSLFSMKELPDNYASYDIVAFFGADMEYGSFYLEDMINAFKYTDSDYITKDAYYSGNDFTVGRQHDFVDSMPSKYRSVFWSDSFNAQALMDLPNGAIEMPKGYSVDCLQYNESPPKIRAVQTKEYKLSVIIPVYNNGLHLYGKAFSSLMRSSMFNDMEIILVDDGSADKITEQYVRYLQGRHSNVVTFFFNDGGSGSASRPRNKGVEMASAPYVTFLDPDNEAIGDGYAKLYRLALDGDYDLTVGNMLRFRENKYMADYCRYFTDYYGSDIVTGDKKDFLKKISFTPMSIQAMVIEKRLITDSGIEQVFGAVGQDSFFSWQLMINARRIKAVKYPVHIYYAARADSVVNTLGANFFRKNLLLEQVQHQWLYREGLLGNYMDLRFNSFFREWLLRKLGLCRQGEEETAVKYVSDIFKLYRDFYNGKDNEINEWRKKYKI